MAAAPQSLPFATANSADPNHWSRRGPVLAAEHNDLYRTRRALRPRIKKNDDEFGICLTLAQAALATPGPLGGFHQWLRQNHIARATAYRLIRRCHKRLNPNHVSEIGCLTARNETTNRFQKKPPASAGYAAPPAISLRGNTLTLQLDQRLVQVFRRAFAHLTSPGSRELNVAESLCGMLARLTPSDVRKSLLDLWNWPVYHFTTSDYTHLDDLLIYPGQPGAIVCS